jgi:hypothetical protein
MSSTEVVTSKKNKQKIEQQQIVSNEITNRCDFEDNKTINSPILSNKNVPDITNKDCQIDVCMEPLLIQDCVIATNQINENNGLFCDASDSLNDPISVCDIITNNNDMCNNEIIDNLHEHSEIIDSGGGFVKANFSLNFKNDSTINDKKQEFVNSSKNKKFLESDDDQFMNQIFFQTITITPTTDEDVLLANSKILNDNNEVLTFSKTESILNFEPVNFFSCKIDEDETFDPNYLESVEHCPENDGENLCSLNENYCSFSSIDYNIDNIQLTQESQTDHQLESENRKLQPETILCAYDDQMLKQRPSIVIDCYDSDSKTEENIVSADDKVNDCCFYFDQTIEEDDGDATYNTDITSKNISSKDKIVELDKTSNNCFDKVNEHGDCKDVCSEIDEDVISGNDESGEDDKQSVNSDDDEGVDNENCLSVNVSRSKC